MHIRPWLAPALLAVSAPAQWSQQTTATAPPSRTEAAMAFDLARNRTVLFGGAGVGSLALRSDTWLYDGADWTLATPVTSPTGRFGASMVFDPARNVTVLFGGITSQISIALPNNQTWEWDGTDWAQASPIASPTGRTNYGLVYDLQRQRVVLYGGSTNPGLLMTSNQTWEYDGTTWTQPALTTAATPGPRQGLGMCYHQTLGRTVLFGGANSQTGGNSDTWLYDGASWTLAPVVGTPPGPRYLPKLVFDSTRNVCVMHGGSVVATGAPIDETWEFDGVVWHQVATPVPTSRTRFAMAFDTTAQKVVLHGGIAGNVALTDTYEYGAFVAPLGPGCPGSNGVPVLAEAAAPRIGALFATAMTNLATGAGLGAIAAGLSVAAPPTPLDAFGMPGCTLLTNVDALVFLPVVSGTMTSQFGIPNDPSLFGVTIHEQGLSLDPGVNAAGLVLSNAITATIGW